MNVTKLNAENWLEIEKKNSLLRLQFDHQVAKNSFDRTVDMILKACKRITREELTEIPFDESCSRAVFYLSFTLLSICDIFTAIQLYRDVKADVFLEVFRFKDIPDEERKNSVMETVISYSRVLDMTNCSCTEKLVKVFDEVLANLGPERFSEMVTSYLCGVSIEIGKEEECKSGKRKENFDEQGECSEQFSCLKKRKVSSNVFGDEATNAACSQAAEPDSLYRCESFVKEIDLTADHEVKLVMEHMKMSENVNLRNCIEKRLAELEKISNDYIATTLSNVKKMLSNLSQHLNLPASHLKVDNQPSSEFKLILLILKEMMTHIRDHPHASSFGFTLPAYLESATVGEDVDKFDISYEPVQSFPENLEKCSDVELYSRLIRSKSIQSMVRLDNLMKAEFLTFRKSYKERGRLFHLDAESYDLLMYLVACVKQMKKDLYETLQQLSQDRGKPGVLYEDLTVWRKLVEFEYLMVNDLVLDFDFCREQCTMLDQEMVDSFSVLMDEFTL